LTILFILLIANLYPFTQVGSDFLQSAAIHRTPCLGGIRDFQDAAHLSIFSLRDLAVPYSNQCRFVWTAPRLILKSDPMDKPAPLSRDLWIINAILNRIEFIAKPRPILWQKGRIRIIPVVLAILEFPEVRFFSLGRAFPARPSSLGLP
jgi:hypothetical protein